MNAISRRTFLRGSAAGAVALYLPGCGNNNAVTKGGRVDQLLLAGMDSGLPTPFTYMRGPGYVLSSYVYDSLLWKDQSGAILPWLASDFKRSPEGTMYTFTLRDGVRWHDGQPLTAEDVAFTYQYFAEHAKEISPQVIVRPAPEIQDVRATGRLTVEFRLAAPVSTFSQYAGAGLPIVPKHIWSSVGKPATETSRDVLVGSGPYRLKSYEAGSGAYLFTASDGYFLGKPMVRRLQYLPVDDELGALMAGRLNSGSARGVRPQVLEPFRRNSTFQIIDYPVGVLGFGLYWNLAKGGALADVRFRRACARAIDRQDMVDRLFGGNGAPGNPGWIPPGNPFHVDVEQYPYDPAAANRMLDEAGYKRSGSSGVRKDARGRPLSFGLLVANQPTPPVTELVVRALAEVGVELKVQPVDTPTFNQRSIMGDSEMSVIAFGGMNSDIATDYLREVYSSKTRATQHAQGYRNPEVDRLVEAQLNTLNPEQRKRIAARAQSLIAQDLPLLPLVYPSLLDIVTTKPFGDWYYTTGGLGGTVPTVENKLAFVTGRRNGLPAMAKKTGA